MNVFGSKQSYSLDEKLTLLRSLHKGPGEDVWAYLVRVRCAVSQILHNCVPTNLEETPDMGHSLVQVQKSYLKIFLNVMLYIVRAYF